MSNAASRKLNRVRFLNLIGIAFLLTPLTCPGQGVTVSTVAGAGYSSAPLPAPAVNEGLDDETGVAVDSAGNVYFGGGVDNVVYKISNGTLSVVAGTQYSSGYTGDGGAATSALMNNVQGVALDSAGNLYIVDYLNYVIRKVSKGIITTIAGNGTYGPPVNGPATSSPLGNPIGIAVDASENVYVGVDGYIVKIAKGTLTIVAGIGEEGPVTNGAPATTQPIVFPHFLCVDTAGNLYISGESGAILKLTVATGTIAVVAGNGNSGFSGDGGPASSATLLAYGVAVDASGNLFIADTANGRIREVKNGIINTIAGGDKMASECSSTPLAGASAYFNNPAGIAVGGGNIYLGAANCIQEITGAAATGPSSTPPAVSAAVNGASFASGGIVPGEIATIFGTNLTSSSGINLTSGLPLPAEFLNVSVMVNAKTAPLFAIDNVNGQQQINFQVPWEVASRPNATIAVTNNGSTSATISVPVLPAQPGIINYTADAGNFGVILHSNFQLADAAHPAIPGETVLIYCTGLGVVSSPPADGAAANGQSTVAMATVTIGGMNAAVSFSGLAPEFVGLYQVNAAVPAGLASGNQPVVITLGGSASNSALLPVQ